MRTLSQADAGRGSSLLRLLLFVRMTVGVRVAVCVMSVRGRAADHRRAAPALLATLMGPVLGVPPALQLRRHSIVAQ